jgi:hypothetical protein
VGGLVLRAWRSGEFLPKSTHDTIVAAATQRYLDLLDRFNHQQTALDLWRSNAERAVKAAETTQQQHAEIVARLAEVLREMEGLRDDLRVADRSPRRPGAREGG